MKTPLRLVTIVGLLWCYTSAHTGERNIDHTGFHILEPSLQANIDLERWARAIPQGSIVLTDSGGEQSLFFMLALKNFTPYIHSGILVQENDGIFVYEAYGEEQKSFSTNPSQRIRGSVRRIAFSEFVTRNAYVSIYTPPPELKTADILKFARHHQSQGTPFDAHLSWQNHEKFYCTEFVALALKAAGAGDFTLSNFRNNPSFRKVLNWMGVTETRILTADTIVANMSHYATIGIYPSVATFRLNLAIKKELHRRFTTNQRLGNIFKLSNDGLSLRDNIGFWMRSVLALFPDEKRPPTQAELDGQVRELSKQLFLNDV